MILRSFVLVAGLAGAVAASQIPELMQQYRQRLGGAVDELTRVVRDFDADAAGESLTRSQALARYRESPDAFFVRRGVSMNRAVTRFERIEAHRVALVDAKPFERPALLWHYRDPIVFEGTLADYRPAVPTTAEGAVYAFAGFAVGFSLMSLLLAALRMVGRLFRAPARSPGA